MGQHPFCAVIFHASSQESFGNRIRIAKAVNVTVIPLEKAPEAYKAFDTDVPMKFVIDPHHTPSGRERGSERNIYA